MSIRTKILVPLLLIVTIGTLISFFTGYRGLADHEAIAILAGKAIDAGDLTRKANADFDRLGELVAEVTAMTHIVASEAIEKRFRENATSMEADLAGLQAATLSPEMTDLDQKAIDRFGRWRSQAEIVLGLKPAREIATLDVLTRDADLLKAVLKNGLAVAGADARNRMAEAAAAARAETTALVLFSAGVAIAGVLGAFWLAGNLTRPLRQLGLDAEKAADGDATITFPASSRKDEIGEISRAVSRIRDTVVAARIAEAGAASDRRAAEDARRLSEELQSTSGMEQARVVEALGAALDRLSAGDLTFRLDGHFVASYARLKTDFNLSVDAMQRAMSAIDGNAADMLTGSREISEFAVDLSQRTSEQTARIEEAAAALEEVTVTVKSTADGAAHARKIVAQTRLEAEKSGEVVRTAVDAIARIQKSSQEINTIINVIDEIAFQTNLLALNAGVEAARAGDSGRGFAVVATEVRALAQRSATASKEIKALISVSNANVDEGVNLVISAGSALDRIFAQVSEIDRLVTNIAGGAGEQATALQSINTGVADIDRMTQRNAAIVESTTAAGENLASRAEELTRSVARFKIEQGRDRARPPLSHAA